MKQIKGYEADRDAAKKAVSSLEKLCQEIEQSEASFDYKKRVEELSTAPTQRKTALSDDELLEELQSLGLVDDEPQRFV